MLIQTCAPTQLTTLGVTVVRLTMIGTLMLFPPGMPEVFIRFSLTVTPVTVDIPLLPD